MKKWMLGSVLLAMVACGQPQQAVLAPSNQQLQAEAANSVALSSNTAALLQAGPVVLTATPSAGFTPSKVEFYSGTTRVAVITTAPYVYSLNLTSTNNGIKSFTAKAYDAAGVSVSSAVLNVNVAIGAAVTLSSSASTVYQAQTLKLTAAPSVGFTPSKVEFYSGTTMIASVTAAPFVYNLALTAANNGAKSFSSKAYAATTLAATSAIVPVSIQIGTDTTPPTLELLTSGSTITSSGPLTLTANATDDVGVTKVEFYSGTTLVGTDTTAPYSYSLNLTSANNGYKTFVAKAYDASGNVRTVSSNVSVTIDTANTLLLKSVEVAQTHVVPASGKNITTANGTTRNLHMVAKRDVLVLIDFAVTPTAPVLEVWLGNTKQGELPLGTPATLPSNEPGALAPFSTSKYWANIPAQWVYPGLRVIVRDGTNYAATTTIKVGAPSTFNVYSLPFYLFGATESLIPFSQTAAPDATTQTELIAKWPVATLNAVNHPAGKIQWPYIVVGTRKGGVPYRVNYKEQQKDGYAVMSAVLNVMGAIRGANGDSPTNNQYYAPLIMANQNGTYSGPGGGLGGGHLGTGDYSYQGVFFHEQGHAFGMPHAGDGYANGSYPYVNGSLKGSAWGYDAGRKQFLSPLIPTTAYYYNGCASGHQLDELNRCYKQDPMQGGSGDQASGYKYTMLSDYNAALIQDYFEGKTTLASDGVTHNRSGGRLEVAGNGYKYWDTISNAYVAYTPKTSDGGLYGINNGLPISRNVPVYSIVMTYSKVTPEAAQIYPPLKYTGNLLRTIDPTNPTDLASVVPNTSTNYWYCKGSGCDYTVRVTYTDGTVRHVLIQGGFRQWFSSTIDPNSEVATSGASYKVWAVNVPADKTLSKVELLETPEGYKGLPAQPVVVASYQP